VANFVRKFTYLPASTDDPCHLFGYYADTPQGEVGRVIRITPEHFDKGGGFAGLWSSIMEVMDYDYLRRLYKMGYLNHPEWAKLDLYRQAEKEGRLDEVLALEFPDAHSHT